MISLSQSHRFSWINFQPLSLVTGIKTILTVDAFGYCFLTLGKNIPMQFRTNLYRFKTVIFHGQHKFENIKNNSKRDRIFKEGKECPNLCEL